LGGGALFFYLSSKLKFKAFLSDANKDLMITYRMVKNNVQDLIAELEKHELCYRKNPREYYYSLRAATPVTNLEGAARLIVLNKTCYNGLYRVNRQGIFNVPIGRYDNPKICDKEQLLNASRVLNSSEAKIVCSDYKEIMKEVRSGDFIYLDPPFNPLTSTANFVGYTSEGFDEDHQIELAGFYTALVNRGCNVLLSNSSTEFTKKLYCDYMQFEVQAKRAISSKSSSRAGHTEILVRNYCIDR
jgi:DNA adenine methylase